MEIILVVVLVSQVIAILIAYIQFRKIKALRKRLNEYRDILIHYAQENNGSKAKEGLGFKNASDIKEHEQLDDYIEN